MWFPFLVPSRTRLFGRRLSPGRPRRSFTPRLDVLEDRTVPTMLTVTNNANSGPGSLRQAVLDANGMAGTDTIVFAGSVHHITLTTGELAITDSLNIIGPGAHQLAVSGNNVSRVFDISTGTVSISGLTITHGRADQNAPVFAGVGGGILNQGNLTLTDVVVSHNRAVGDASALIMIGGYVFAGAGLGGGVANLGTISVSDSTFAHNQALGGDHSVGPDFPNIIFPGLALGGGLYNLLSTANVSDSHFAHNTAQAGSDCVGSFAGTGGGGGIYNDATLIVSGSTFSHNRALGGSDCVSDLHNGHGLGGGIVSGSVLAAFGGPAASLAVSGSTFDHNQAIGGDDNHLTLPVMFISRADGPSDGFGGGIAVYQGTATISQSVLSHNRAVGGAGGADQNGSLAVVGGIFIFHFIGGVTATISGSVIAHNDALGGPGRSGGRGGDGLGGGLAAGGLGSLFSAPGTVAVSFSLVAGNLARGGDGGSGGNGGNGLGGGIYNDAGSTLTVSASLILLNEVRRGRGGPGGSDGQGIGGGVYNLGTFTDVLTLIALNRASTSHDNVFP
jgi:hypothetical protein